MHHPAPFLNHPCSGFKLSRRGRRPVIVPEPRPCTTAPPRRGAVQVQGRINRRLQERTLPPTLHPCTLHVPTLHHEP